MQQNEPYYLSLIVPVYNAETFLANTLGRLDDYLNQYKRPAELILVDDGSRDSSPDILKEFAAKSHPYPVTILKNQPNKGKGYSVARGFLASKGKYRVFTDCDMAYPPSEIDKITLSLERGFDVAVACRVHKDSRYTISPAFFRYLYTRHIASRFFNFVLRMFLLPLCRDSQAGLKGFTSDAAQKIFSRQKIQGFSFDMEALFLADRLNLLVEEVSVNYSYFDEPTTIKFLEDSLGVLRDILRIKWRSLRNGYKLPEESDGIKRLIVNADDFGLTDKTSRGIIETIKNGIVTTTSIMANSFVSNTIKEDIDTGIHFTLTYGRPVTEQALIKSLADKNGAFYPRGTFYLKALTGRIDPLDVYRELSAQLKLLKAGGIKISHIDSHHHVHILPGIRDIVAQIALENNVRFVRAPYAKGLCQTACATFRKWIVSRFEGAYPQFWHRKGIHTIGNFGGFELIGDKDLLKRWKKFLKKLPYGTTEVMVHPGLNDETINDSYIKGRATEVEVLKNPELKEICRREGIELVNFNAFSGK